MANSWNESGTTWSQGDWGQQNVTTIFPSGVSSTSTLGNLAYAASTTGWGSESWGFEDWGENSTTVTLTGLSATSALGSVEAFPATGWGGITWGNNNWGDLGNLTLAVDGLGLTSAVGEVKAYNEIGWPTDRDWETKPSTARVK